MVAQPLKITERMQEFGNLAVLRNRHFPSGQLHQVCTELIFIFVNQVFLFLHLMVLLLGILRQKLQGARNIFPYLFCHAVHRLVALRNG